MNIQKIFAMGVVGVVGVVLIVGVVLPVIADASTHTETVVVPATENEDPVGDLRLNYTSDTNLGIYVSFDVSGSTVAGSKGSIIGDELQTADYEFTPVDGTILFATDRVSVTFSDSVLYLSLDGFAHAVFEPNLTLLLKDKLYVSEGSISLEYAYSFVYYPDADGTYANYSSYTYDSGDMYATGGFAGYMASSQSGDVVGDNPFGFTSITEETDDETTGVHYEVVA